MMLHTHVPAPLHTRMLTLLALLLLFGNGATAQTLTPKEWEKIQLSEDYLIGMGISAQLDDARQLALSDLAGKISTKVEQRFDYVIKSENTDRRSNYQEKMNNIVHSYSSVKLNNVAEHLVKERSQFTVYRYMKVSELNAMFRKRVEQAHRWAEEGHQRQQEGRVGDALQAYYWALALLRSTPDGDLEEIKTSDGRRENMQGHVFRCAREILERMTVAATSAVREDNSQRVTLRFLYGDRPAVNFKYRYVDGKNTSDVYTVKDGIGELLLPAGVKLKKLTVQAEYECREEANIYHELSSVMDDTEPVPFQAARLQVDTRACDVQNDYVLEVASSAASAATPAARPTASTQRTVPPAFTLDAAAAAAYLPAMQAIEQGIARRELPGLKQHFTDSGWQMFQQLISYGDARLLRSPQVQFVKDRTGVACRSFPMSFTFKGNRRTFTEDVVFYLNAEGKVDEVAFALEQAAVDDIMSRGEWSQEARQVMVHFLETYKTAYALKRLDYINSIFSNDALIITGSIVKASGQKEIGPAKLQHVKYTRQTKEQYMASLRRCFGSNEYINIHFADNIVRRSTTKPDVYGIQIKQDYFSSSYGDTGYLFLLIDFEHPEAPLIHVRTWQPDDDPNVKDGRIGIADFLL